MSVTLFFSLCVASLTVWVIRWLTTRSQLDNIPGPQSQSFRDGNMKQLLDRNGWDFHKHVAEAYGSVVKIHGWFGSKLLYVIDTKALHHILVKDQYDYDETPAFLTTWTPILGVGLLTTSGDHHRKQRKMLNPAFATKHMRYMLPTFYAVAGKLRDAVAMQVAKGTARVDISHWTTRAALELIGQSGLGYSFDPLTEEVTDPYAKAINSLSPAVFKLSTARHFLPFIVKITTPGFRKFMMDLLPWKALHELRDLTYVLQALSHEVVNSKRSALASGDAVLLEQIGQGKDIMSILLKANMEASVEDRLSEEEVLGQVSTFILGAIGTTSTALSRILYLLAERPKVQEMLRKEIVEARQNGGDLSHDELVALPYLDAIVKETLRLHPMVPNIIKTACKDVILPFSKPLRGVDGKEINEIALQNNTDVVIAIWAVNRSTEIWGEDAAEWKPERWLSPLPNTVGKASVPGVYSNLLTFIGGAKACIGFRFGILEIKVVLSLLLESFSFALDPDCEIMWNMGTQSWPSVRGSNIAQMPIQVSKL